MNGLKIFDRLFLALVFLTITFPLTNSPMGWVGPASVWALMGIATFALLHDRGTAFLGDALKSLWFRAMLALLAVEILMIPVHGADPQARYAAGRATMVALSFLSIFYLARTGLAGFRLLQKALVYSAVLLVFVMTAQALQIFSLGNETDQGRLYFGLRLPFRKVTGFLMSDGRLGTILVPAFLLAIAPAVAPGSRFFADIKYRPVIAMLIFVGIVLTQSRSAYVATLMGFSAYGVLVFRSKLYRLTSLLLMVLAAVEYGKSTIGGFQSEGRLASNVFNRFSAFEDAILNWQSSPAIGVGHQNMMIIRDLEGRDMFVHNMFFDQLGSLGLIGLAPLVLTFAYLLWKLGGGLIRNRGTAGDRPAIALFLATTLAILVELNLYRGFYNEYSILYSTMALAVILYIRRSDARVQATAPTNRNRVPAGRSVRRPPARPNSRPGSVSMSSRSGERR